MLPAYLQSRLVSGGILLAGVVLLIRGGAGPSVVDEGDPRGRPECPGDGLRGIELKVVDSAHTTHIIQTLPLSGPNQNIPEFHDCQRFILPNMQYDSLYAIFAAFDLHRRLMSQSIQGSPDSAVDNGAPHPAVAVATIYTNSVRGYAPLAIKPGINCLYLFHPSDNDTTLWGATMVQLAAPDSDCAKHGNDVPHGSPLHVRRIKSGNAALEDYPEAARWDWDPSDRTQYIGIACRDGWCEVSGKDHPHDSSLEQRLADSAHLVDAGGVATTTTQQTRVYKIKGWYDAQILAKQTREGQVPSNVFGVIVPNPSLASMPKPTMVAAGYLSFKPYDGAWVNVGAAVVTADYKELRAGVNLLYFCHGSATSCKIPSNPKTPAAWIPVAPCPSHWFAKLVAPNQTPQFGCATVTDHHHDFDVYNAAHGTHYQAGLPATARWHWLKMDDLAGWHGCTQASCCKN